MWRISGFAAVFCPQTVSRQTPEMALFRIALGVIPKLFEKNLN
jgi:hypothetical protein